MKNCKQCTAKYKPVSKVHLFCSTFCRNKWHTHNSNKFETEADEVKKELRKFYKAQKTKEWNLKNKDRKVKQSKEWYAKHGKKYHREYYRKKNGSKLKDCLSCGDRYKPYKKSQKFCSNKCRYKHHDKRRKPNQRDLLYKFLNFQRVNHAELNGMPNILIVDRFYESIK